MAIRTLEILKSWFVTHAKPTQAQFHDVFDSFRHKNDRIIGTDLDAALLAIINDLPGSATIEEIRQELLGKATVTQFNQLSQRIDNIQVKTEPVVMEVSGPASFVLPEGRMLHKIVLLTSGTPTEWAMGNAPDTDDIIARETPPTSDIHVYSVDIISHVDKTLYFSYITEQLTIRLYFL